MKLSIITINKDNLVGLKKTMASVLSQSYKDFEYIVVDGASTDGSVDVMKEYEKRIQTEKIFIHAISERDAGIYDAMNKGVRKSVGEYVLMLNSGDYLLNERVLESILPDLDGTDIVQGNTVSLYEGNERINRGYGKSDINFIDVQQGRFLHQASFCRKILFDKFGYFDVSYKIDGDTVFYVKTLGYGDASFKYVDLNIAYFDLNGRSNGNNKEWKHVQEEEFYRWSTELFSSRLWNTCIECDKKNRLYDKLHVHSWAWNFTMLLVRIIDRLYK